MNECKPLLRGRRGGYGVGHVRPPAQRAGAVQGMCRAVCGAGSDGGVAVHTVSGVHIPLFLEQNILGMDDLRRELRAGLIMSHGPSHSFRVDVNKYSMRVQAFS